MRNKRFQTSPKLIKGLTYLQAIERLRPNYGGEHKINPRNQSHLTRLKSPINRGNSMKKCWDLIGILYNGGFSLIQVPGPI